MRQTYMPVQTPLPYGHDGAIEFLRQSLIRHRSEELIFFRCPLPKIRIKSVDMELAPLLSYGRYLSFEHFGNFIIRCGAEEFDFVRLPSPPAMARKEEFPERSDKP